MPKTAIKHEFPLKTRSDFTKVDCEVTLTVNGNELPNLDVLGKALEVAIAGVQAHVTESYKVVPERV
jgi:hypothetical protein